MSPKQIELQSEENDLMHLLETARRAGDTESKLKILKKLTDNIRLQDLAEAAESLKEIERELPRLEPLTSLMSKEEFERRIA